MMMEGELRVASVSGQGSRFFFDLPLYGEPAASGQNGCSPVPGEQTPPVIPTMFALPSTAKIQALLTLSLEGDIIRLRERLKELVGRDVTLVGFTREIETLAAGFRMDAISDFLGRMSRKDEDEI